MQLFLPSIMMYTSLMISWIWVVMVTGLTLVSIATIGTCSMSPGVHGVVQSGSLTPDPVSYHHIESTEDQLQSSSRKLLDYSQTMIGNGSTEIVMATKSSTISVTTSVSTYPTLDQSFSTRPYWLTLDMEVPENTDITARDFIFAMETNLAKAYTEGKNRRDTREASVQELLERLNPDNDPLLNRRKKRAVTYDGNTAQVIDLSRHTVYPVNVVMVFYLAEDGTSISAGESKAVFDELTLPEITFYLQIVVESTPSEVFLRDVMTTAAAPSSNYVWIILVVIGAGALLFLACSCCFCIFCRRPVKPSRDGPMDMDTLKMLQHKQKYPYKPYKTPNQTPRGFDVAKETDVTNEMAEGTVAGTSGSGMRLENSSAGSVMRTQLNAATKRLDTDPVSSSSGSLNSSVNIPVVPPLQLQGVQDSSPKKSTDDNEDEVFHKAVSTLERSSPMRSHHSYHDPESSRSQLSYSWKSNQPRLLPLRTKMTRDVDLKSKTAVSSPRSPLSTSREGDELRRIYQEAQNEISRVLNPDVDPYQSDLIYVAPDKRRKKKGKSSKGQLVEQETKFDGGDKGQMLPDTHYARRSGKQQMTSKRRPEALHEARRRVHHLIDEAFSLVGLPKNAVSPIMPIATDEERPTRSKDSTVSIGGSVIGSEGLSSTIKEINPFVTAHQDMQDRRHDDKEGALDGGSRVLVVPVSHIPNKTSDVVWNPYHAEDELTKLHQSQQLTSVTGRGDVKHKPDNASSSHLNMPHPVSVTKPSNEPWMTRLATPATTNQEQPIHERHQSDGHVVVPIMDKATSDKEIERRPSTGLKRTSTDLDYSLQLPNTALDDPYLDPYLKKSYNNDLSGSVHLPEFPTAAYEEDPYTMALSRYPKKDAASPYPGDEQSMQGNMLSTLPMERRVGKPVADGYDEIDVTRAVTSTDNSGKLVAAIRDELIRLAKKSGQNESSS